MKALEKEDMQGLIVRGYGKLPFARFVLLQGKNKKSTKQYLSAIHQKITPASESPDDFALNIAFTSDGLRFLELPETSLATFSREFLEGMSDKDRAIVLGDQKESDPNLWDWGGTQTKAVHVLLLLYAKDNETLDNAHQNLITHPDFEAAFIQVAVKETSISTDSKEHFGFRDGISRPTIKGLRPPVDNGLDKKNKDKAEPTNAGEFVLGYENEYNRFTEVPTVLTADDPNNILQKESKNNDLKSIGINGTYLVYREIEQEVFKFWKYLEANSQETADNKTDAAILLGSKMVGRWPSGCPIVESPEKDDPSKAKFSDFNYFEKDKKGLKCPMGSHVRRTNPRDHLIDHTQQDSVEMIRKHQLLRRGRIYGPPIVESMKPEDILKLEQDDKEKRGLHFICLNVDISRQFEFVQSIWAQSSKFAGLNNDADPIIGTRITENGTTNDQFVAKSETSPIRNRYKEIPQFTKIVGGGYFFLPGLKALKFIAHE